MRYTCILLAAVFMGSFPAISFAQFDANGRKIEEVAQEPMTLEQILPEVNKASVVNGGKYATARALLDRRVFDAQGKAAGEVREIYVGAGGAVAAVEAVFSRLHLSGDVALDLQLDSLTGSPEGYNMGFGAADIKSMFPALMNRTKQTPPEQKGVATKKLVGADVKSSGGEDVGRLKEVLFDANGEHADLAYLLISYGPFKNKPVVVPFGIVDVQMKRERPELVISSEDLATVFKFLTK